MALIKHPVAVAVAVDVAESLEGNGIQGGGNDERTSATRVNVSIR